MIKLRVQAVRTSASARGMLGKASEVAAAAEQSAVAMREAAQTAAGLIRAIEDARNEVEVGGGHRHARLRPGGPCGRHVRDAERARQVDRIDPRADPRHCRADQPARAQRDDRGCSRGRCRPWLRGGRAGSEILANQTARATDDIAAKIAAIQSATKSTVETNASIRSTVAEVQESANRIRSAMEVQAQTVTAITAAVDETALAADSMSATIGAIREDTETVASEIDRVGQGFAALDGQLGSLKGSASDFVMKVAA